MTVDKTAMRKQKRQIRFDLNGACLDCIVIIEPRTGSRWRVTIFDDAQLGDGIVHVEDIQSDETSEIELLRLALNAYREHRGPAV